MALYFLVFFRADESFCILDESQVDLPERYSPNDWKLIERLEVDCIYEDSLYRGTVIQVSSNEDDLSDTMKVAKFLRYKKKFRTSMILEKIKRFKTSSERNILPTVSFLAITIRLQLNVVFFAVAYFNNSVYDKYFAIFESNAN